VVHGTVLADMAAMQIAAASHGEWRLTGHTLVRCLRIAVLTMLCALALFNLVAPERVQAMLRPPSRDTPGLPLPSSLPMKYSIFPPPSART
jgi:hypothetical protein